MASSGYTIWSVVAGEQPTTSKWNLLGANDASFNSGAGLNDAAIVTRHLASNTVSKITTIFNEVIAVNSGTQSIGTTFTTVTNWGAGQITTSGGDVVMHISLIAYTPNAQTTHFRIAIDGVTYFPSSTGWTFFMNLTGTSYFIPHTLHVSGLAAGTHTVAIQLQATSTTLTVDSTSSYANLVAVEYLR